MLVTQETVGERSIKWELSVLAAQFFCESKTAET